MHSTAATCPSELLAKVRGLYGDRLQSLGREVRTLRDPKAERDETLLLGQLHEIKSAMAACKEPRWCTLIAACGESIAVCGLHRREGAADVTELMLFDPCARPVSVSSCRHCRSFVTSDLYSLSTG